MYQQMTQQGASAALNNDSIMSVAPSVFATAPHNEVSDRYGFMPTINVIDALRNEGWMPVSASQKNVRDASKKELTKHLVRFRRLGNDIMIGDSVAELLLTNSHDRSSAFVLHAGLFRMACANGIVISDATLNKLSVRHGKNVIDNIIEGVYDVVDDVPVLAGEVEGMQETILNPMEQAVFARHAYVGVYGERDDNLLTEDSNIAMQLLRAKRHEDKGDDLWRVFNRVQENITKGGVKTMKLNQKGRVRRSTSRAVKAIDKNITVNKLLWSLAAEMKALKAS